MNVASDSVMLGLAVFLLAMFTAALLFVVIMGQTIIGTGQNKLQGTLTSIQEQDLQQYSNMTKKGNIIKAAVSMYQGEPITILIKTADLQNDSAGDNKRGHVMNSGEGKYFCYGILVKGTSEVQLGDGKKHIIVDGGKNSTSDKIIKRAGQAFLETSLDIVSGVKKSNYDTSGIVETGNPEMILDNALFYCQLLKDNTGKTVGIIATQQK